MTDIGQTLADFSFHATSALTGSLNDYRGKTLILYFYPKDATPGCTTQGQDFRDFYKKFQKLNIEVLGVSRDSLAKHEKFKAKHEFPFELISDEDETLCQQFDVIKEKNMYGRKYMGIERSTFIINPEGVLTHVFRKVRVKGHVEAIYSTLTQG